MEMKDTERSEFSLQLHNVDAVTDDKGNKFWLLQIPPDGNCLFGSLVHQMYGISPMHTDYKFLGQALRESSVTEIRANMSQYYPHLASFAAELVPGDACLDAKIETYLEQLRCPTVWGGAECLTAISNSYGVCISVFQNNAQFEFRPSVDEGSLSTYRLYYRGYNGSRVHYDSVVCARFSTVEEEFCTEDVHILNSSRVFSIFRPGFEQSTQIFSILHQLTRRVASEQEVKILRELVASEIEVQPVSYLNACGIECNTHEEFIQFVGQLRNGTIDGINAPFVVLSALLKIKIYVHSVDGSSVRYGHVSGECTAVLHILREANETFFSYASVVSINDISSETNPLLFGKAVGHTVISESQETEVCPVIIDDKRGLRFASLNVNGCRSTSKRSELDAYLLAMNIHVAVLQEVNLDCCEMITNGFQWFMGKPGHGKKRGLAVLVRRGASIRLRELHSNEANIQPCEIEYEVLFQYQ